MKTTAINPVRTWTLAALGLASAAMGIYVANADDKPGTPVMSTVLLAVGIVLAVKAVRSRLSTWAARTAIAVGVVLAAFAAIGINAASVTAPLFPQPQDVPAVAGATPPPHYASSVERARELVRAAVLEQNLPGLSVAVGAGGALVWAEGFGYRDVMTRTPVTPDTRFNIGTAAAAVTAAVAPLGLTRTGAEPAAEWSPEAIGEPGEDFPGFTFIRNVILRPIGLARAEPIPGERATFYVPRTGDDPRSGRRLMYMRDLACCANGMAFYSTPSDLVRVALANNPGTVTGELAGGMVSSLTSRDSGIVVAVTSNIAHANTSTIAQRIADAFAEPTSRAL